LKWREQSIFQCAFCTDSKVVVDVDVMYGFIDWYLPASGFIFASFPPDLHAAGKVNINT